MLARLVADVGQTAHLGILHGRETLYLLKRNPPRPQPLVTAVGVRLPAQLTASGRAMLAALPAAQVRALFLDQTSFVDRTGAGPATLPELRRMLAAERRRGWAEEDGHVMTGYASVAAASVDHTRHPIAAISVTFRSGDYDEQSRATLAAEVMSAANRLRRQLGR